MVDDSAGYSAYYQRPIDDGSKGIKLILGPTGLGKSSSIPKVIRNNSRKAIYMANRKELLQQMAADLNPDEYVILRRDLEVVQDTLTKHYKEFDALLTDRRFVEALKKARTKHRLKVLEVTAIRRACQRVMDITNQERLLPDWLSKEADGQARIILQAVRLVIMMVRTHNEQGSTYKWLTSHPVVETLFPAIVFRRRPEVRIMLVTLHKAYYGFFDGAKVRNLTDLSDEKDLILFWDEFDFLENDLVKLICRVPQISDPFDFVARFYRVMVLHKLPKEDYPQRLEIRERIKAIVKLIREIKDEKELDYPDINQFTLAKTNKPGVTPAIFRTSRTISTGPLYLHQTTRSYQLEKHKKHSKWVHATWIFNRIGYATTLIIALFKELEREDENTYWELMRQCFRNSDFFDQVITIPRLPHPRQKSATQRSNLLHGGYCLFDINDLQQRTDNEEVEVYFYQMLQTPENLLFMLAQKYLIFALSATADLRRCIHHFDLDWLESEGLLLPTTDEDRADIQQLSTEKAQKRNNTLSVVQIDGLDSTDPFQAKLEQFLQLIVHNDEFDEDNGRYRSRRMHRFFASLLWALKQSDTLPRQLLFFNSFRQIRLLFTSFAMHAAEAKIYTIEPLPDTPWFQAFRIVLQGQQATVIFFNAELTTQVRQSKDAEHAFVRLFWSPDPVVVVTQYLSAGNGVNLKYTNEEGGKEQDFTSIGLLEDPYYFFTKPDHVEQDADEIFAGQKENIWYQAKLYFAKWISESRFLKVLETTNRPNEWNSDYKNGTTAKDNLFNRLAIFMQALGRVERTWDLAPPQTALLSPDVFTAFQAFLHEEYETIRANREPFASANLKAVLSEVATQTAQFQRLALRKYDGRLKAANDQCREAIHALVARLEQVRSQGNDLQARRDWEELRQAVLKHDFQANIVRDYGCVTSSRYYSKGRLNISMPEMTLYPLDLLLPEAKVIKLDAMYSVISANTVIQEHFHQRGYDFQFDHPGIHFFTPYCLQAILAGAVGEEAIEALLENEQIPLDDVPDQLFEVIDRRVAEKPWFIDCKNYNEHTLERFSLPQDDPLHHPTLNEEHFSQAARIKLKRIIEHAGEESKLIYINLVSSLDLPLRYYNRDFQHVPHFDEAEIIIIPTALDRQTPNFYQPAFTRFLSDIKKALKIGEEEHQ